MKIILDVFNELHFVLTDEFLVEYAINENNSMVVNVNVLISSENDSQVFLMIDCENAQLKNIVDGMLIKEMAFQFRKKEYHRAEMDRNTALLIVSKLEKEAKYQWELSEYLNRDICQPEGFDAYGYPTELFKLDMERLGIVPKRKPAKVIDFTRHIDTNRSTNH